MYLTKEQINKIKAHFGDSFYNELLHGLAKYSDIWGLSNFEHIDYYSVNCLFKCHSYIYGDCVIKIGKPCREVITEYNALNEYNNGKFCNVFNADTANGVLLLECIKPAIRLREITDINKRLEVFCSIFSKLHIKASDDSIYPSYINWVDNITNYMKQRSDYPEITAYMIKAQEVCRNLSLVYNNKMLLHGDLHHDNIVLSGNNYVLIDPKGVIGDKVFDIPRYILNELFDETIDNSTFNKITHIIKALSINLNIPDSDICKLFFIETTMANCWNIESQDIPSLKQIEFAYSLMNKT